MNPRRYAFRIVAAALLALPAWLALPATFPAPAAAAPARKPPAPEPVVGAGNDLDVAYLGPDRREKISGPND